MADMTMEPRERVTTLPAAEVQTALERVLESATFKAAPQLAAFLRFVVETTLSGHADIIKAYTVAVEALGRPENFDPTADATVRVEGGRLRHAIARYYDGEGAGDPVIIDVPVGSYVPQFRRREAAATGTDASGDGPTGPLILTDVAEEAQIVLSEHRYLFAECHLSLQDIRDKLIGLRAEFTASQSAMAKSRRLVEGVRDGAPAVDGYNGARAPGRAKKTAGH